MQSGNSCQSCILGMAELLECGCVDLRDTNNKYPELLQLGRERSSGAERALPAFIVERILFFLFFYMQIKLQDYYGLPSLLTSAVSLLSDSAWPRFPALGTGQEIQVWFLLPSPFAQLLGELSRCSQRAGGREPCAHSRCRRSWHLLNRNLEMISSSLQQMSLS